MSVTKIADARDGRAVITIKNGYSYEADVRVANGAVHTARTRRKYLDLYYPADDFSWPLGQVRQIRWIRQEAA